MASLEWEIPSKTVAVLDLGQPPFFPYVDGLLYTGIFPGFYLISPFVVHGSWRKGLGAPYHPKLPPELVAAALRGSGVPLLTPAMGAAARQAEGRRGGRVLPHSHRRKPSHLYKPGDGGSSHGGADTSDVTANQN